MNVRTHQNRLGKGSRITRVCERAFVKGRSPRDAPGSSYDCTGGATIWTNSTVP